MITKIKKLIKKAHTKYRLNKTLRRVFKISKDEEDEIINSLKRDKEIEALELFKNMIKYKRMVKQG